jgi:1-acyl-sn-glycerol-3-phosphate acyltransferase
VFYWFLKGIVLGPILRAIFRPWLSGEGNVPVEGAAILASNHLSFSDSIFLPLMLKRRVTFLAKADYFTGQGLKGRLTAGFFRGVGQVPLDRAGGGASGAALDTGLRVLRAGELLGIYPEGTRSPDARLYRGKTGVARMALEAKVPVIPVAMIGTDKVQPIGRIVPHLGRVGIVIGQPLDFSRYDGMEEDRFVLRSITDEIMYELMQLSGQEYVDVYAATMKERLAAARRGKPAATAPAATTPPHLTDPQIAEAADPSAHHPQTEDSPAGDPPATSPGSASPGSAGPGGAAAQGEGLGVAPADAATPAAVDD